MDSKKKRAVFAEVAADYMEHTSLHGYRYLTEPGRHWIERILWVIVHVAATAGVIWQVRLMYIEYENQVPITTVQSMQYHVSLVPFPAIALCDINKISFSRAKGLSSHLVNIYGITDVSEEELTSMLRYLGRLYDNIIAGDDKAHRLADLLSRYNVTLDYRAIMQNLTTTCEELLLACRWDGKIRNCSDIFELRKTMEGYCCTFNYVRASDNFDTRLYYNGSAMEQTETGSEEDNTESENESLVGEVSFRSGQDAGLSVLVHSNVSEYFYPLLPTIGVKVLVYNPLDYPDTASGGLIEKIVMPRREVLLTMSAVTTLPTADVYYLPRARRKCLFSTEKTAFSGPYSYSDCLMECRVRSMLSLCGCLPFFSPVKGRESETRVCELRDVQCLNKHTEMWQTLRPDAPIAGLELEMTESLICSYCFPACSDTAYSVQTTVMPFEEVLIEQSAFLSNFKIINHSVLHIYFGSNSQKLMKKSVLMAWYDLLSNVGGICGVFVGFSTMSIVEFVYFFTLRAMVALWSRGRGSGQEVRVGVGVVGPVRHASKRLPSHILSPSLLISPSNAAVGGKPHGWSWAPAPTGWSS